MDCIIPGGNIKVVRKAVQTISKIGDYVKLVPEKDCLTFRCLNRNKTAYCSVYFKESFFSIYDLDEDVNQDFYCNISIKALLGIFKHQPHKDNQPLYFKIQLAYGKNEIIFKTRYKNDIVVVKTLKLSDMETNNVSFQLDQVHNQICAPAHLFSQVLTNFQLGDDDFSFETKSDKIIFRNYDPASRFRSKGIRSQLTLHASEFKTFQTENNMCITFSHKTFKAVVNFAETFNLDVTLNFEKAGRPCFVTFGNSTFDGKFLIATISSDDTLQTTVSSTYYSMNQKIIRHFSTTEDEETIDDVQPESNKRTKFDDVVNEVPNCGENDNLSVHLENGGAEGDHNMENDDVVSDASSKPQDSSQVRKLNQVFQRCYDKTFQPTDVYLGKILAFDTDSDTDEN